jgi:MinD-like ATPase involved in chromosome partitioning or flagellar assembly
VLIAQGLHVLLVDLTGRRACLNTLFAHGAVKNLVYWAPTTAQMHDIPALVEQARRETTGHADVILLDIDAALLEHSGGFATGVDYVVTVTEPTEAGQQAADRIAERLHDALPPYGRVGVVFSRIDAPSASSLPESTSKRHLPVIGYYPADYLLASGEDYSLKGGDAAAPHDTYLFAMLRLGQRLMQLVPLKRVSGAHDTKHVVSHPHGEQKSNGFLMP